MIPPTSIDGTDITGATIDGQDVQEITVDGNTVFTAENPPPVIPGVVDNFEEVLYEDENRSLSDVYGGDLGVFSRQQSVVFSGDYALEFTNTTFPRSISDTDYLNHPSRGDSFQARIRRTTVQNGNAGINWATQDESDNAGKYGAKLNFAGNSLDINRYDPQINKLVTTGQSYNSNEWYRLRVDWENNGDITATLFDDSGSQLNQISTNDTTYTSGGVGYDANSGSSNASTYIDDYEIL
jgi:hypothetical protein